MFSTKTRIVLRVKNAARSAAFYEALLSAKPAERTARMASFDTDSPPLLLTVEESPGLRRLSSFSLWVESPRRVGNTAIALRRTGARLRLQDRGIEAVDPDGNAWHIRLSAPVHTLAAVSKEGEP
jgi:catechol 2,3-dioxygenase-like lactoylglutathione lyase family enzyme